MNPPRQLSTWSPTPWRSATSESSVDGVDGPVAVVAGGADDGHGLVVDVLVDPADVDERGLGVHRGPAQFDAEEMARLVEGGVGGFGLDDVGSGDPSLLMGVLPVGQHGVGDAPRAPRRHEAGRSRAVHSFGMEKVQCHGDDFGFELGGARAHVALERVDVREQPEGFGEEVVVVVVAAVHRPRAFPGLPEGVLLLRHHLEVAEDLLVAPARFGEPTVDLETVVIGEGAHSWCPPVREGGQVAPTPVMADLAHCTTPPARARWGRGDGAKWHPRLELLESGGVRRALARARP